MTNGNNQASDAYYSSLETGQHVDGLLGLGTMAGRTHSQADALVALLQYLDLNPNSAQAWNHLGKKMVRAQCTTSLRTKHDFVTVIRG